MKLLADGYMDRDGGAGWSVTTDSADWNDVTLGFAADAEMGWTPPSEKKNPSNQDHGINTLQLVLLLATTL